MASGHSGEAATPHKLCPCLRGRDAFHKPRLAGIVHMNRVLWPLLAWLLCLATMPRPGVERWLRLDERYPKSACADDGRALCTGALLALLSYHLLLVALQRTATIGVKIAACWDQKLPVQMGPACARRCNRPGRCATRAGRGSGCFSAAARQRDAGPPARQALRRHAAPQPGVRRPGRGSWVHAALRAARAAPRGPLWHPRAAGHVARQLHAARPAAAAAVRAGVQRIRL